MKTTSKSKQEREGKKRKVLVKGRNPQKLVGSGDAEAALIEDTEQRNQTGLKRVKTRAEKDAHKARCVEYRKNKKLRFEELEKTELKYIAVLPELEKIRAENQMMIHKMQRLENENMELRAFKEQIANQEQMMRQIPTSWEFGGQKISSFEHCQDLVLSQKYEQVCQGSDYPSITASDARPSFVANPDFTTQLDVLYNLLSPDLAAGTLSGPDVGSSFGANHGLPGLDCAAPSNHDNNGLFIHDPAAGTLSNPGAGSSFGANHDLPVFDVDSNGLFIHDPAAGTLSNPGAGSSFGANHDLPVFDVDSNGLFIHDPAAGTLSNPGASSSFGANHDLPVFDVDSNGLFTYDPADGSLF